MVSLCILVSERVPRFALVNKQGLGVRRGNPAIHFLTALLTRNKSFKDILRGNADFKQSNYLDRLATSQDSLG